MSNISCVGSKTNLLNAGIKDYSKQIQFRFKAPLTINAKWFALQDLFYPIIYTLRKEPVFSSKNNWIY